MSTKTTTFSLGVRRLSESVQLSHPDSKPLPPVVRLIVSICDAHGNNGGEGGCESWGEGAETRDTKKVDTKKQNHPTAGLVGLHGNVPKSVTLFPARAGCRQRGKHTRAQTTSHSAAGTALPRAHAERMHTEKARETERQKKARQKNVTQTPDGTVWCVRVGQARQWCAAASCALPSL